jgi:hypothetical protein
VPHYDRHAGINDLTIGHNDSVFDDDEDAMDEAAQALREAEVEAVWPAPASIEHTRFENMSIDELRALAAKLDVPNRGAITDEVLLIAAIRERM